MFYYRLNMELSKMPVFITRLIYLCVLGNIYLVNCSAKQNCSIDRETQDLEWNETSMSSKSPSGVLVKSERIKRQTTQEIERNLQCLEVQTPDGPGVQKIREIKKYGYSFFVKPKEDFQKLIFHMIINNDANFQPHYLSEDDLVFRQKDFADTGNDSWSKVKVEYFKHVLPFATDKLALRVTMNNKSRSLKTRRWWRTHSYVGFRISTEGGAYFLFDCFAIPQVHPNPVSGVNKPLVLGGILGVCFLLVIVGWLWYLVISHPRRSSSSDRPPIVPPLPASLLLGSTKVKKCPDVENIYEEFDEETLARLRKKMNPKTLGECDRTTGGSMDNLKKNFDVTLRAHFCKDATSDGEGKEKVSCGSDSIYMNDVKMSLIDEKMKASDRDSVPESHYVEMHGILNSSSLDTGR